MASSAIIGWFETLGLGDRAEVGGKGGSLGELTRAGITVPPGFVVKTAAFEEFMPGGLVDAMRAAAPAPRHYDPATRPVLELLYRLLARRDLHEITLQKAGFRLALRSNGPRESA